MALASYPYPSTSEAKHYDVFLSFRGEDTRDNFISHLYKALCQNRIETFMDNDLHRGNEISESLSKAIKESKIAIIVFSKGYASSTWCLEELAEIIECKKSKDLIVVPVFYHVDPSDVRQQTGTFGEAFVSHEKRFEGRLDVCRWKIALTEAAKISGFDSKVCRPESALIEAIVKDILRILNDMYKQVGIGERVEESSISSSSDEEEEEYEEDEDEEEYEEEYEEDEDEEDEEEEEY